MKLRGKVAIVTGSSQGIGRGIAKRFAQEGANVVINYSKNPEPAREALADVEAAGGAGSMLKANLGDVPEIDKLVEDAIAHFGGVDILVNNAGVERHAAFWDVTGSKDYDAVCRRELERRLLRDAGGGRAPARREEARPDRDRELRARGAAVSELRPHIARARAA